MGSCMALLQNTHGAQPGQALLWWCLLFGGPVFPPTMAGREEPRVQVFLQAGVCCLHNPRGPGPACAAPDPNTRGLVAGRGSFAGTTDHFEDPLCLGFRLPLIPPSLAFWVCLCFPRLASLLVFNSSETSYHFKKQGACSQLSPEPLAQHSYFQRGLTYCWCCCYDERAAGGSRDDRDCALLTVAYNKTLPCPQDLMGQLVSR